MPRWLDQTLRLAPFRRLAITIKKHRDGILEHSRSGLTNGFRLRGPVRGDVVSAKATAQKALLLPSRFCTTARFVLR